MNCTLVRSIPTEMAVRTRSVSYTHLGGLSALATAVQLSRATMRKIKQNLFWAFFYNIIGIPVAALGFLDPLIAGAAMAFSSVSVVPNSMLLKKSRLERRCV